MQDCQLYLISPLDVSGTFPGRLERALEAAPVAAFQFRVKGMDDHAAVGWRARCSRFARRVM